jgi:uncharacterized membrane protein
MKIKIILFFVFACTALVFNSCRHEADFSNAPVISFSNDVQPIITTRCAMDGCHSTYNHEELSLVTYEDVMEIVKAGNSHNSKLYETITALNGEKRMPPLPDNRLAYNQITKIMVWIEQGAKNN